MRILIPLFAIAIIFFSGACTREYTCQCVIKYSGKPPGIPDTAVYEFAIKNSKKEASSQCEANTTTVTQLGITMDEKCKLY